MSIGKPCHGYDIIGVSETPRKGTKMKSVMLDPIQRLLLKKGLRKLAASGEAEHESLKALQRIIDNSIQIRVEFVVPS